MKDLYILGSGFSKALSARMPLVRELSEQLGYCISAPIWPPEVIEMVRRNFEDGLSYLSESKPFLSTSENLKHQHLLLDLTQTLATHTSWPWSQHSPAPSGLESSERKQIQQTQEWLRPDKTNCA
jgi:hypothetical protein